MSEDRLDKTRTKLQQRAFSTTRPGPIGGAYLFFSFDLVNSTRYKQLYPNDWPIVITHFYDLVANEMATRFTSTRLWKHIGDEILFYKRVTKFEDVWECLPLAHAALSSAIASLHQVHPATVPLLSLKGSIWIADVDYIPPSDVHKAKLRKRNLVTSVSRADDGPDRDFLGPEIDTGFRIGRFVRHRRLIVSAHLACVLHRQRANCADLEKKLKIVGYEELKGVWDGRQYPIIWYEENWPSIADTFLYDEHLVSNTVARIKGGLSTDNDISNIDRIFAQLGRSGEVDKVEDSIRNAKAKPTDIIDIEIPRDRFAEVHCVAVCVDANNRVLVGKRPSTKKRFANVWEFGCGQLKLGESFEECLRRTYSEDFGAEIEVASDPTPIATFRLEDKDEHRTIPGLIFAARVKNPDEIATRFVKEKHSEIKWVPKNELPLIRKEEFVPGFVGTASRAIEALTKPALRRTTFYPNAEQS